MVDRQRSAVTLTPRGETFRLFAARILKAYEDLDVVFSDYEAFADIADKLNSIKDEPAFSLFREIFSL